MSYSHGGSKNADELVSSFAASAQQLENGTINVPFRVNNVNCNPDLFGFIGDSGLDRIFPCAYLTEGIWEVGEVSGVIILPDPDRIIEITLPLHVATSALLVETESARILGRS